MQTASQLSLRSRIVAHLAYSSNIIEGKFQYISISLKHKGIKQQKMALKLKQEEALSFLLELKPRRIL